MFHSLRLAKVNGVAPYGEPRRAVAALFDVRARFLAMFCQLHQRRFQLQLQPMQTCPTEPRGSRRVSVSQIPGSKISNCQVRPPTPTLLRFWTGVNWRASNRPTGSVHPRPSFSFRQNYSRHHVPHRRRGTAITLAGRGPSS